ncbi:SDR family NAD(P)-dependent oxidoreductase [Novosphingobium sp. Leaf2]|uniref:SDR family NAD(P)-dependent oxidoreductase n=1 Tax=Novosphingobium sp. Leaf2 TaxID=1735670 RepID=UPI0006F63A18|nr:SDR family oxidoreductase [Novosphingobium sp. Leaf2]KQM20274.1 short-chain dehydrogenase [Novosphingobium sp. Leaf2]
MTDKTAIITGGGAGIGRGLVLHFAGLGWRVAALDLNQQALDELGALLPADRFLAIACDVGNEPAVRNAFSKIGKWTDSAHLLVNNAGIADPVCGPLEDLTAQRWHAYIDASLTATFLCTREALPLLRAAAPASVVNMSSTRAQQSEPDTFAYAAAKGGVSALTHAMAVSLGPDIRVNAVLPGWIETGPWQAADARASARHSRRDKAQHPVGRVGTVEDIAQAVEWLAGAGFVTGQEIVVDGGMTKRMIYAQ